MGASLFNQVDCDDDDGLASDSKSEASAQKSVTKAKSETTAKRAPSGEPALRVSQIADRIGKVLLDHLPRKVRVVGEMSNLSQRNHWYFSLKDDQAVLNCVAWASKAKTFRHHVENGMEVLATGSVQFYSPQGRCQLYVDKLEPMGLGSLELQLRALIDELKALGYFDASKKKRPPTFPKRVAVITSEKGAALQDVLDTLRRRCPAIDVVLCDVRVQGAEAASEIANTLAYLRMSHVQHGIEAVILTRGGGSIEDLWAFNERAVADALLDFPVPTIAAIGHETDTTIAELVADVRCATPTQAAMVVSPDRDELMIQIDHAERRFAQHMHQRFALAGERLRYVESHLCRPETVLQTIRERVFHGQHRLDAIIQSKLATAQSQLDRHAIALEQNRPVRLAASRLQAIGIMQYRLNAAIEQRMKMQRDRLGILERESQREIGHVLHEATIKMDRVGSVLMSINPTNVLARGYTITRSGATGKIIHSASDVTERDDVLSQFADGEVRSRVIGETQHDGEQDLFHQDEND